LHPLFPKSSPAQSTSYYSDNFKSLPVVMKLAASIAATAAKAQHDPHYPCY